MWALVRRARHEDDGFSVVEIVVSAAILFFALTALVGLLGTSTNMTASAKSRGVLTNKLASEIDWVRSLPYSTIGLQSVGTSNAIPATKVDTVEGYTITYTYTVTDHPTQYFKEVTVSGVAERPGFAPVRASQTAYIRDRIGGVTKPSGNQPTVKFISPTPAKDTVVQGSTVQGGDSIKIRVRATSPSGANIARIVFEVDCPGTKPMKTGNSAMAQSAGGDIASPAPEVEYQFTWYSDQVDGSGVKEVSDGRRTITVTAYDDQGVASPPKSMTLVVDNVRPPVPADCLLQWSGNADMSQNLYSSWGLSTDGTDAVPGYEAQLFRNVSGSGSFITGYTTSPQVYAAQPFSIYGLQARAVGPIGWTSDWSAPPAVMTRPVGAGTFSVTRAVVSTKKNGKDVVTANDNWTFASTFSAAGPQYPYTNMTVEVLKTVGATATTVNVTTAAKAKWDAGQPYVYTDTVNIDGIDSASTPSQPYPRYQLRVSLKPTGYGPGTQQVLLSNTMSTWIPSGFTINPRKVGSTLTQGPLDMQRAW